MKTLFLTLSLLVIVTFSGKAKAEETVKGYDTNFVKITDARPFKFEEFKSLEQFTIAGLDARPFKFEEFKPFEPFDIAGLDARPFGANVTF